MDQAQPHKNELVEKTRAAGAALGAGDMEKLRAVAKDLHKTGTWHSNPVTQNDVRPQLPHLAKHRNDNTDTNYRAIYIDKPPPAQGHGR